MPLLGLLALGGGAVALWWLSSPSTPAASASAAAPAPYNPSSPPISVASGSSPSVSPVAVSSTGLAAGYYWEDQGNTQMPASPVQAVFMSPDDVAGYVAGQNPTLASGNVTFQVLMCSDPKCGLQYGQMLTLPLSYVT